ncbi:hypothetical protein CIP107529_00535 [Corynebacterium diphtheriae]|nr:hypothetical protein CIP107523_00408 [Corynebacterium diphtheriae]CAB0540051.1 hypothetical protein CIP107529_00535 [Corynebacterium diphtheriae]
MMVDYLSSQPNRAGYQVSTKKGSGPTKPVQSTAQQAPLWPPSLVAPLSSCTIDQRPSRSRDFVSLRVAAVFAPVAALLVLVWMLAPTPRGFHILRLIYKRYPAAKTPTPHHQKHPAIHS